MFSEGDELISDGSDPAPYRVLGSDADIVEARGSEPEFGGATGGHAVIHDGIFQIPEDPALGAALCDALS